MHKILRTYRDCKIAFPIFLAFAFCWSPPRSKLDFILTLWRERKSFRTALRFVRSSKMLLNAVKGTFTIG